MTKDRAYEVMAALNDIDDFELFMDEIHGVYCNTEGNFEDFYNHWSCLKDGTSIEMYLFG